MAESFLSWRRSALSTLVANPPAIREGRLTADFPLALNDGGPEVPAPVPFVLTGPQDVHQVNPEAIVARRPTPGAVNVEITHEPYVELAEPDLPWRYSPVPNADLGIRPWLVLLVGATGTEITVGNGQVVVSGPTLDRHNLDHSAAWAHVHAVPDHGELARILAPRVETDPGGETVSALAPDTDYTCALVPAWLPGGAGQEPVRSWSAAGNVRTTLPLYDTWTFRTIDDVDDFKLIAERLEPLSDTEAQRLRTRNLGRASVGAGPVGPGELRLAGAITIPDGPPEAAVPARILRATSAMARLQRTPQGRWLLGLPRYDDPWAPRSGTDPVPNRMTGWRLQLHRDPRHRGVAGLGAWASIAWQDRITDAAAAQAGALALAAERVRFLGLGLAATRSQWTRRVPEEPQAALAVLSPVLRRLPTSETTTAIDSLSGRTAWLGPALFSSAARRMLRPRGPVARAASRGAARVTRLSRVAATTCPPAPRPPTGQDELVDRVADPGAQREAAGALDGNATDWVGQAFDAIAASRADRVHRLQGLLLDPNIGGVGTDGTGGTGGATPPPDGTGTSDGTVDPDREHLGSELAAAATVILASVGAAARPVSHCDPIAPDGWTQVATSVVAGIDPHRRRPVAVDLAIGGFTGLREPALATPDVAPELDIPLWSFLRDNAPDWLLPGGGDVPQDRVLALATNQAFVDAFLVGANQQALAELRRRNIPVTTGWTPLRRFWQRIDEQAQGPATDIEPVLDILTEPAPGRPHWPEGSPLGDPTHQRGTEGALLIILLHTELFRRYPSTQVYLVSNPGGTAVWGDPPEVGDPATHVRPILSGALDPELVFFGFPVPPSAAESHWLVLEEPPPGYRFRAPSAAERQSTNAADYAARTLVPPVRAFFGNLL